MKSKTKNVSFEEIKKKFAQFSNDKKPEGSETKIENIEEKNNAELDSSHFDFDSRNPNAILIAGCCGDGGSGGSGSDGCGSDGGSAGAGDGGCK